MKRRMSETVGQGGVKKRKTIHHNDVFHLGPIPQRSAFTYEEVVQLINSREELLFQRQAIDRYCTYIG